MVPQEVVDSTLPYYNKRGFGNPTLTHKWVWEAFEKIMDASKKISQSIGPKGLEEITFTPGETEANNLALLGSAFAMRDSKGKKIVNKRN